MGAKGSGNQKTGIDKRSCDELVELTQRDGSSNGLEHYC